MADVYGTNATSALNTTPASMVPSSDWGGRLRAMNDTYEASSAAAGTVIILGKLPKGAKIQPQSNVRHDALATAASGGTLAIKLRTVDGGTLTTLVAATLVEAAGTIDLNDIDTFPYEVTAESYVVAEVGTASATGTIKSNIVYTVD